MQLSPGQAADSLKEIERTERRSAQAHIYANASPGFILWGLIWMIGYAGSDVLGTHDDWHKINWLWCGLTLIGVTASMVIGRRQHRGQPRNPTLGIRWGATFCTLWLFVVATFIVLRPVDRAAAGAFIPLIVAAAYAIFGIWSGLRFLYAGIAVAALTLGGYLWLPEHFLLWMAVVGGGSLILVGLWLRQV